MKQIDPAPNPKPGILSERGAGLNLPKVISDYIDGKRAKSKAKQAERQHILDFVRDRDALSDRITKAKTSTEREAARQELGTRMRKFLKDTGTAQAEVEALIRANIKHESHLAARGDASKDVEAFKGLMVGLRAAMHRWLPAITRFFEDSNMTANRLEDPKSLGGKTKVQMQQTEARVDYEFVNHEIERVFMNDKSIKVTFGVTALIAASIVLGSWLSHPRYIEYKSGVAATPMVMDTWTGVVWMWGNDGKCHVLEPGKEVKAIAPL